MRLHYHPGKANVVANALSGKSYVNTIITGGLPQELADDLRDLQLERSGVFLDLQDTTGDLSRISQGLQSQ